MTYLKIKPCPQCGSADYVAVFKYDSGNQYVECDNPDCINKHWYRGPGSGSINGAIKAHNEAVTKRALTSA